MACLCGGTRRKAPSQPHPRIAKAITTFAVTKISFCFSFYQFPFFFLLS